MRDILARVRYLRKPLLELRTYELLSRDYLIDLNGHQRDKAPPAKPTGGLRRPETGSHSASGRGSPFYCGSLPPAKQFISARMQASTNVSSVPGFHPSK